MSHYYYSIANADNNNKGGDLICKSNQVIDNNNCILETIFFTSYYSIKYMHVSSAA